MVLQYVTSRSKPRSQAPSAKLLPLIANQAYLSQQPSESRKFKPPLRRTQTVSTHLRNERKSPNTSTACKGMNECARFRGLHDENRKGSNENVVCSIKGITYDGIDIVVGHGKVTLETFMGGYVRWELMFQRRSDYWNNPHHESEGSNSASRPNTTRVEMRECGE